MKTLPKYSKCASLLPIILEPACCKKWQKIVPDQLLIWEVGDLWRIWKIPNWFYMSLSYSHDQLGLVWHNQNLQRAIISQISNWSGTIFDRFLLQIGFRTTEYFYLILEISQQILRFESKTQIKNFTILSDQKKFTSFRPWFQIYIHTPKTSA